MDQGTMYIRWGRTLMPPDKYSGMICAAAARRAVAAVTAAASYCELCSQADQPWDEVLLIEIGVDILSAAGRAVAEQLVVFFILFVFFLWNVCIVNLS